MAYTVPDLPYPTDALEPHIDAKTMEVHHDKHHAAYVEKANAALEGTPFAKDNDPANVCMNLSDVPADKRTALRNNAGGAFNHTLFWSIMAPPAKGGGGAPSGDLAKAIERDFGSFDTFKQKFAEAATGRFGSGWAWLVVRNGKLEIVSTANQDNPLMGESIVGAAGTPILGLDVWEHAYYLTYQNRRPDYIKAWWNVVNWPQVEQNLKSAR